MPNDQTTRHTGYATDREEQMADALHRILQWTLAYPVGVFREPDIEAIREKIGDDQMSALHGTWARHLLMGIGRYARQGLNEKEQVP